MSIKVLFWNIENFRGDPCRTAKVVAHIEAAQPDIVGFSEIKDKAALRSILQRSLHQFDFGITDGRGGIELLAGWRRGVFDQALFTQRREFRADNPFLRPGSLLSVAKSGTFYNFLFLHTDSGREKRDYDNRQHMFERIWSMRARLDEIEEADSKFIVLGDVNTMGRKAVPGESAISGEQEIAALAHDASANGMRLLDKSHADTWARVDDQGRITLSSNLDHVIATRNLGIEGMGEGAPVLVRGWVDSPDDGSRKDFVDRISDHCPFECLIAEPNA